MVRNRDDSDDLRRIDELLEQTAKDGSSPMPIDMFKRILEGESPVRVWRELRGLTAAELARRAGVVPSAVSNIETGGRRAGSLQTLRKLAKVLEVDVDDLLPAEDEGERSSVARASSPPQQVWLGGGGRNPPLTSDPPRTGLRRGWAPAKARAA